VLSPKTGPRGPPLQTMPTWFDHAECPLLVVPRGGELASRKSGALPDALRLVRREGVDMGPTDPSTAVERGFALTQRFLVEHEVPHRVIEHSPTYTAEADAHATHLSPEQTAKSVVVNCGDIVALAVIPASCHLDLDKLTAALDGTPVALADEAQMARAFPAFEIGAEPPMSSLVKAPVVIDKALLGHDEVVCAGGDHHHSLLLDPLQLARVSDATIAEISGPRCVADADEGCGSAAMRGKAIAGRFRA
jgi:prolyl-tRNA editing enzyme YbaK/EbsC (Cys-tRNA(Pro) deacylase)